MTLTIISKEELNELLKKCDDCIFDLKSKIHTLNEHDILKKDVARRLMEKNLVVFTECVDKLQSLGNCKVVTKKDALKFMATYAGLVLERKEKIAILERTSPEEFASEIERHKRYISLKQGELAMYRKIAFNNEGDR